MSVIVIRCPETGREVSTGILTTLEIFRNYPDVRVNTRCPHCGQQHTWTHGEAWLAEDNAEQQSSKREPATANY